MRFEPAQRTSLSERVRDQLLARIRNGSLRAGDRLPGELELVKMLHVGRSSVREALRSLITLGLVETKPGRGAIVVARAIDPFAHLRAGPPMELLQRRAVLDLLEVRESLEGQAAELAAERASPLDLVNIERHELEIEKEIRDGRTYFRSNSEFHTAVARASHNRVLAESVRHVIGQVRLYRERLMREVPGMPENDIREHRAVLEAIRARDPDGARRAMIEHIHGFRRLVSGRKLPPANGTDGTGAANAGSQPRRRRSSRSNAARPSAKSTGIRRPG
jgi:GntR family transcriptional repressor for pyruvate dehydrogenase complex